MSAEKPPSAGSRNVRKVTFSDIQPMTDATIVHVPDGATQTVAVTPEDHSGATSDDHLVELWLHGRPASTRRVYTAEAVRLLTTLATRGKPLRAATLADIQEYVTSLVGAPATRKRKISTIKSLLSFAHRTGYSAFNIGSAIRAPKLANNLAERILAEEGVIQLITAAKAGRNRVLIRLLYVGGLRVSEACDLRWQHIHPRDNGECQITIHGKGDNTRHVLVTPKLTNELTALRGDCAGDVHVFLSRTGRPLGPRDARRVVARVAKAAGLNKPVSPHWMRHAHASHALDRGAPVHLVQKDLGHASLATTSRYAHAKPADGSARFLPA